MNRLKPILRALAPFTALVASTLVAGWVSPSRSGGPSLWTPESEAHLFAKTRGLSLHTFTLALRAYERAVTRGETDRPLLTIIDYSLPSTQRRLWVLDLSRDSVLFHEWVAHGQRSGGNQSVSFSNRLGSRMSSLGAFLTTDAYTGRNGYSLRLRGLEPGFNDNAEDRAIVMHGAPYVSRGYMRRFGRLGRSLGCPALRREIARNVIDAIKGGSLIVAYYPDSALEHQSRYLGDED